MAIQMQQNNIPVIYSKILLDLLAERGFHTSAILRGTGVELSSVADPEYKLTLNQQNAIYENAMRVSKIKDLGLLHGERIHLSHMGIVGYAIQTSSDLKQALRLIIRYIPMVGSLMDFQLKADGEMMSLTATDISARGQLRQFVLEEHLASIDHILKMITGDRFRATKVGFDYAAPTYATRYTEIFKCPVEFSCSTTEYKFHSRMLDLEDIFADPVTADACEKKCDAIIERMRSAGSYVDQIRRAILMLPCESRNLTAVADEMNTTTRSLRRKLSAEQATFQKLLDEVRLELATDYLKNTNLTLEDIAPLLGFSDASNFRHAFKKWTGELPSSFRNDRNATHAPPNQH
jgi:AraC-like DNA-binding protein